MASERDSRLFVVAIDFGTTYSGYAFSTRSEYLNEKSKIQSPIWNSGQLLSHKSPTILLLNKEKEFVNFGYDAENCYSRMTAKERMEHYYFHRFKMMLYTKDDKIKLTRNTVLSDIGGKEMPAIDVFAKSIKHFKDHFIDALLTRNYNMAYEKNDVTWVLTVPAIWDEPAKQFMQEAAEKAGICKKSLLICLEPEAAAIYCKWISIEKDKNALITMKPGRRFLVLDAGGGTVDMAMQEVREDGKLQEINRAEGGDWGGIYVDDEFKQMLECIVSKPVIESFRMEYTDDYIELFRHFETKKRENQSGNKVNIQFPASLLEIQAANDIAMRIENKGLKDKVELKKGRLFIQKMKYEAFFNKAMNKIVVKVEEMLVSDTAKGTKVIIMVGGFSESLFLQRRMRDSFPNCTVVQCCYRES